MRHKSHTEKVMFLNAQAGPRHDCAANKHCDSKIGIWPVGDVVGAKRSSKRMKKGDPKQKNKNIDFDICFELMEDAFVVVAASWPRGQWNKPNFHVGVQQDGAKVHTSGRFQERWERLLMDLVERGILPHARKVQLDTQPANSSDLNINDFRLFVALQSQHWKTSPNCALELVQVEMVKKAHCECPGCKIN